MRSNVRLSLPTTTSIVPGDLYQFCFYRFTNNASNRGLICPVNACACRCAMSTIKSPFSTAPITLGTGPNETGGLLDYLFHLWGLFITA